MIRPYRSQADSDNATGSGSWDIMSSTEKLLRELIGLPSVNPAFLPTTDPRAGERRVADFLAATAARAGLEVEFQTVLPNRPNLLARFSPAGRVPRRILL